MGNLFPLHFSLFLWQTYFTNLIFKKRTRNFIFRYREALGTSILGLLKSGFPLVVVASFFFSQKLKSVLGIGQGREAGSWKGGKGKEVVSGCKEKLQQTFWVTKSWCPGHCSCACNRGPETLLRLFWRVLVAVKWWLINIQLKQQGMISETEWKKATSVSSHIVEVQSMNCQNRQN